MKDDRLISLNAAIDVLRDRYYKYDRFAKIEELVWAIEALPSAQPTDAEIQRMQDIEQAALEKAYECGKQDAQRWIPYDYENIPSPGENVLVTYKCDDGTSEVAEGVWIQPFIVNNCFMDREVIAWMPIPEPYEEGDK